MPLLKGHFSFNATPHHFLIFATFLYKSQKENPKLHLSAAIAWTLEFINWNLNKHGTKQEF